VGDRDLKLTLDPKPYTLDLHRIESMWMDMRLGGGRGGGTWVKWVLMRAGKAALLSNRGPVLKRSKLSNCVTALSAYGGNFNALCCISVLSI